MEPSVSADDRDGPEAAQRFAFDAARETIGTSSDVDSCASLAARIDLLMSQAFGYFQKEGAGIACRAGCGFCCHLRVMVHPHEAIALFRYLGSRMPEDRAERVRVRLIENAARISGAVRENRKPESLACAFLVDNRCSAYEVRPSACSGYHSLSKEQCERAYEGAGASAGGIPILSALRYIATALDEGLDQALAAAGLSAAPVELHTAVAALIRNPRLIDRWRSGRSLLKGAPGVAQKA